VHSPSSATSKNRKTAYLYIGVAAIFLGIVIGLVAGTAWSPKILDPFSLLTQKTEVSNVKIEYGSQTLAGNDVGGSIPILSFTVRKEFNSNLYVVGCKINDVNYGTSRSNQRSIKLMRAFRSLQQNTLSALCKV
jgi:hypothetical protein